MLPFTRRYDFKDDIAIRYENSRTKIVVQIIDQLHSQLHYPKLEMCVKYRLYNFLETRLIFSSNQFGFRRNKGTNKALMTVISHIHIHDKLDENRAVIGLFLDVNKAFDSVDHSLLLAKLERYGIRGNANNLICNFFKNRIQQVRV